MHQDLSLRMQMTVIVSLLQGSEQDHGPVLDKTVEVNVSKTKEMFSDFRRPCLPAPCVIRGKPVAAVQQSKYLGTVLDHKLNFGVNTDGIHKKANQSMFFFTEADEFKCRQHCYKNDLFCSYQVHSFF